MQIKENDIVLFQGDSITDCHRDKSDPDSLGLGYPYFVASQFNYRYPHLGVKFYNRGISGNRAGDLVSRWQEDCIDLHPTVVSVYIGINDTWRNYDQNMITTPQEYEANYRFLLDEIKAKLDARLIIIEPFVLPFPEDRIKWREDLDPKIQVCRKLALEYGGAYVPLDGLFAAAQTKKEAAWWAYDGVHPTGAGHALIADAFMKTVIDE